MVSRKIQGPKDATFSIKTINAQKGSAVTVFYKNVQKCTEMYSSGILPAILENGFRLSWFAYFYHSSETSRIEPCSYASKTFRSWHESYLHKKYGIGPVMDETLPLFICANDTFHGFFGFFFSVFSIPTETTLIQ